MTSRTAGRRWCSDKDFVAWLTVSLAATQQQFLDGLVSKDPKMTLLFKWELWERLFIGSTF